jgi:hypothetical protein
MPLPANGDVTASQLLQIKLKAEQMWQDSQLMAEYMPNADAAIAVLKNQTARFEELTNSNIDNKVTVNWINPCGITVQDCEPLCTLDGQELSTGGNDYELSMCKQTLGLKINREKFRTNLYDYDEFVAAGILQHIKALDEYWAQQILVKLKAFAGVNVAVAAGGIASNGFSWDGNTTQIPADQYNVQILTKLLQQQIINKMPAGYIIDDGWMYQSINNSLIDQQNLNAQGDAKRAATLAGRVTFDQFNFALSGVTEDMFIVNPGAVAFKTKTRNPDVPTLIGGNVQQTRYTVPSRVLPGVKYDVYYTLTCVVNETTNRGEIVDVWNFETLGDIFLNPNGCPVEIGGTTYTPTGVLGYERQAA